MPKKILPTLGPIETNFPDRVIERKQGCWNCTGFSREMGKKHWSDRRQKDLEVGLSISLQSPLGEQDPKVKGIRQMVDNVDHGVASGSLGMCLGHGVDRNGNPVGDLVMSTYLCEKWNGAQGASVARGGEAPDTLPAELEDKLEQS
jgi:hypothetical protein